MAEARRFRTDVGLRSDDAWIVRVALDPSSDRTSYGVPLTTEEVEELGRRVRGVDEIKPIVVGYGEQHSDDWGGAWVDQEAGGILAAQFTRDIEAHRRALFAQVAPDAPLEVRQVRWSRAALEELKDRVRADDEWFALLPADVTGLGLDISANAVFVELSSPNLRASELVQQRFDAGPDLLRVTSDGTGARLLPRGSLSILVVDTANNPLPGLGCAAYSDLPGATDPHPQPMPTTDESGICLMELPATGYWIEIESAGPSPTVLAYARAVVDEGGQVTVRAVVGE